MRGRRVFCVVGAIVLLGGLSGCSLLRALGEDSVVLSVSTDANTRVAVDPGGVTVSPSSTRPVVLSSGDQVTLEATPQPDSYSFLGWSGDVGGSANPTSFFIEEDMSVSATSESN